MALSALLNNYIARTKNTGADAPVFFAVLRRRRSPWYNIYDYDDCRFAMETVNGEVLAFDEDFQRTVYEKYKKEFGFTDNRLRELLAEGDDDDESDRDIETDLSALGVEFEEDSVVFNDKCGEDGYELMDLLEELGWDCSFEGDSWKLETIGVYFIR